MNLLSDNVIVLNKIKNDFSDKENVTATARSIRFCKTVPAGHVASVIAKSYPAPSTKKAPLTKAYSCSDALSSNVDEHYSFILPNQLEDFIGKTSDLRENSAYVMIDCRSQIDYGCERIHSAYNINCRAKIMSRKLLSKRLEDVEPSLSTCLSNCHSVILYDQSTDEHGNERFRLSPIYSVIQAARRSNKTVYIVEGGIEAVKKQYPHLIERIVDTDSEEKSELDSLPKTPNIANKENLTMTEIIPRLFVGNKNDAQNLERLTLFGITHIINCTPDMPCYGGESFTYMQVPIPDLPSENIRKFFDETFTFIDDALETKTNKVLVHCSAGISRSSTLVLAYMIKKCQMTFDEALAKMRQSRDIVDPNIGFIIQLRDWEKTNVLAKPVTAVTETTNDSASVYSTGPRVTPFSSYCGSTSKSKAEKSQHTESPIVVN